MARYARDQYSDIISPDLSELPNESPTRDRRFEAMDKYTNMMKGATKKKANLAQARESLGKSWQARDLETQQHRRWKQGDVYAPHDLSPVEMRKWRRKGRPTTDAFDALAMNPLNEYKNFSIMSEYMTAMGRIKHSSETGLRPVNQRRIAKAIRRSIGLGIMPSVHRHPELLEREMRARGGRGRRF
ncbi:MAG: hypothetical protein M1836_000466 [Candelina mexicana]|nr:MAG: hypothetical protein M1836_000466 [Candelina mexicana]